MLCRIRSTSITRRVLHLTVGPTARRGWRPATLSTCLSRYWPRPLLDRNPATTRLRSCRMGRLRAVPLPCVPSSVWGTSVFVLVVKIKGENPAGMVEYENEWSKPWVPNVRFTPLGAITTLALQWVELIQWYLLSREAAQNQADPLERFGIRQLHHLLAPTLSARVGLLVLLVRGGPVQKMPYAKAATLQSQGMWIRLIVHHSNGEKQGSQELLRSVRH